MATRSRIKYGIKLTVDQFVYPDRGGHSFIRERIRELLEQLRYADAIEMQEGGPEFTIWQPDGIYGTVWQQQQVERMASFGFKPERVQERY